MIDANGVLWFWQVIAPKQSCHETFEKQIFVLLQSVNVRVHFAQGYVHRIGQTANFS